MSQGSSSSSSSGGIGFAGALTIAFIVLKLTHVIDWSWLWVLSPLWISWAIVLALGALALMVWGVVSLFQTRARNKRLALRQTMFNTHNGAPKPRRKVDHF